MDVGDKVALHSNAFPSIGNDKKDTFVVVTVVERRDDVPDVWTAKKDYTGFRAVDAAGREYFCNWDSFPSDSMTPMWSWYSAHEAWYDIVFVDHSDGLPAVLRDEDFIEYCPKHKQICYTRGKYGCFECYMDKEYPDRHKDEPKEKKAWLGWK